MPDTVEGELADDGPDVVNEVLSEPPCVVEYPHEREQDEHDAEEWHGERERPRVEEHRAYASEKFRRVCRSERARVKVRFRWCCPRRASRRGTAHVRADIPPLPAIRRNVCTIMISATLPTQMVILMMMMMMLMTRSR